MSSRPTLSQRAVATALRHTTRVLQGYTPDFLDELVRLLGVTGFFKWSSLLHQTITDLDARWGHAVGQLLIGTAAMWNGCRYCGVGHTYAGNLAWFEETGTLLPFSETHIARLQDLRDEEALAELRAMLGGDAHVELLRLIERLYRLKFGEAAPQDEDDFRLLRTIAAWDLVNECSILSRFTDPDEIEALSPMAKNEALIARYREARRQAR